MFEADCIIAVTLGQKNCGSNRVRITSKLIDGFIQYCAFVHLCDPVRIKTTVYIYIKKDTISAIN